MSTVAGHAGPSHFGKGYFQGGLVRGEVFIGSTHLATYFNGHTYFPHTNWQGSESVRTSENGTKVQECEWRPFGDLKGCTTGARYDGYPFDYAGYEYDSETGNYHMPYRYYNPRIGRFLTADSWGGTLDNPQTVNQFGYVGNDPQNFTDPTGLCPAEYPSCGSGAGNPVLNGFDDSIWGAACRLNGIAVPCYVLRGMGRDSVNIVTFETPPCPSSANPMPGCSSVRWDDNEWQEKVRVANDSPCPPGYVCNTGSWHWETMNDPIGMHVCGDFVCDFWNRQRGIAPDEVVGLKDEHFELNVVAIGRAAMIEVAVLKYPRAGGGGLNFYNFPFGGNRIGFDIHRIKQFGQALVPHIDIVIKQLRIKIKHWPW